MADDKQLKIVINLDGYVMPGAKESVEILEETKRRAKETGDDLKYVPKAWDEVGEAEKGAAEKGEHTAAVHRALHQALHHLNELIPGLGSALGMLSHGLGEAGEAAEGASEGMLVTMGPMAILLLTIQAMVEWYKFLGESSKEGTEAQVEYWKSVAEAVRKAREETDDYEKALRKARSADDDYRAGIEQDNAVLNAQVESQKKVLKSLEENELAHADSEEKKKAIRQKYADIDSDVDKKAAEGRIQNMRDALPRIADEEKKLLEQKEQLEIQRNVEARTNGAGTPAWLSIQKQIKEIEDSITKLETDRTKITNDIGNAQQIQAVQNQGTVNQAFAGGDVGHAVKGIADIVQSGGVVDTNQKAFFLEFADDLAHRLGQLKPNQNFNNAAAAANFIENFFKTQTDPYAALFTQIHAAILAAKTNQDAMAQWWTARFTQLQAQISHTSFNNQ